MKSIAQDKNTEKSRLKTGSGVKQVKLKAVKAVKAVKRVKPVKPTKMQDKASKDVKRNKKHALDTRITDYYSLKSLKPDRNTKHSDGIIPDEAEVVAQGVVEEKEANTSQAELSSSHQASSTTCVLSGLGTCGARAEYLHCDITNHHPHIKSRDHYVTGQNGPLSGAKLAPIFTLFKKSAAASGFVEPRVNLSENIQARPESI